MHTLKTLVLMVFLTVFFIFVGSLIGGKHGATLALIMALGMNFFAYFFSHKIVLAMYGAKEVSEAEAPELYNIVRRLAQKAELPMPKVYIIDSEQPNAFATGRSPKHGVVAVTTGIMRILSREELEGVIGHELAHIKHRDILISTIAATIAGMDSQQGVPVRSEPSFSGRVLGYLTPGTRVQNYPEFVNGWAKIQEPMNGAWIEISNLFFYHSMPIISFNNSSYYFSRFP